MDKCFMFSNETFKTILNMTQDRINKIIYVLHTMLALIT